MEADFEFRLDDGHDICYKDNDEHIAAAACIKSRGHWKKRIQFKDMLLYIVNMQHNIT